MNTKMKNTLLAALLVALATAPTFAAFSGSDDFNDNSKDPLKWGTDSLSGSAALTETNQRLQFTTASASAFADASRPWIANTGSFTADWGLQLDVNLPALGLVSGQLCQVGMVISNAVDPNDTLEVGLSLASPAPAVINRTFGSLFSVNGGAPTETTITTTSTAGAIRVRYVAASTTLLAEYDADGAANGYLWTSLDSRSVAPWAMNPVIPFQVSLAGFTNGNLIVTGGQNVFMDNFLVVPEPGSALLLLLGAGTLLARRRPVGTRSPSAFLPPAT